MKDPNKGTQVNYSNETLQSIAGRRSIRSFSTQKVEKETLETLMEMAGYAPSPLNNQPWRFYVLQDKKTILEIAEIVHHKASAIEGKVANSVKPDYLQYRENATFFKSANAVIVVALKPMDSDCRGHLWGVPGFFSNEREARGDIMCIGAACQNVMLAAHSMGLGSCMMLYPLIANDEVSSLLDIRAPWKIMAYLPVGYGANGTIQNSAPMPKRRRQNKIVEYI